MDFLRNNTRFLLFLCTFLIGARSQSLVKQEGFWFGDQPASAESILVEAFFDPVCPDTRDSWPPLRKAVEHYGSAVSLVVYTFPLPYHDNAFVSSRVLHVVNKLNTSATYIVLEKLFEHQKSFYGEATFDTSRSTVVDKIVKLATDALGTSYRSSIESGFTDPETDHGTRVSFKYGCIRGVYGTPFFFVNGLPLTDVGSELSYEEWRRILDPLCGGQHVTKKLSQRRGLQHLILAYISRVMDRYHKVEKPKVETPIDVNEIRITSQGRMRSYITYAMSLLQEKDSDEIVFKAMGRAINKTVTIVELIKRRIVGLHQITMIQSTDITDTWEPLEEGLQTLETTRKVSMVTITLSKKELDKNNIGYQPPIPADQVKVSTELDYDGGGNGFASAEYEDGGYERNRGYSRGRGRGRGYGYRGRGRGGYGGPQVDNQYNAGGYDQEAPRGTVSQLCF
ncbi:hypothetical protein F511_11373 [Dorcoceras hygrometricum]|uniref:DNA/RNA-binding protein Alba-like domain-containing protein n=1 Tax=Dorcoceras hygrometricum TaxID=472368 RepID=A0A2Z7A5L1_9LAMI|nr:hypothetical protein F511_11373 [Dorcoceras hygrometricum]